MDIEIKGLLAKGTEVEILARTIYGDRYGWIDGYAHYREYRERNGIVARVRPYIVRCAKSGHRMRVHPIDVRRVNAGDDKPISLRDGNRCGEARITEEANHE